MTRLLLAISNFFLRAFISLPRQVRWALADGFGLLCFDVLRIRRGVALRNISRAFPQLSRQERIRLARASFKHMGRNMVQYAEFPELGQTIGKEAFQLEGRENLEMAQSKGKGVLMLTLHLGNGDFALGGLALNGIFVHVISKEFKIRWLNRLWFGARENIGVRFIPPRHSSYAILKALRKGETVAFVLDQFMGPPIGVKTTFFGHETGTAMGLAVMAQRAQAPVVPIYTYRRADGKTAIVIEPEIPFKDLGDQWNTVAAMTQTYTNKIEDIIRKFPEQWMWIHRRWKPYLVQGAAIKKHKTDFQLPSLPVF